MTLAARLSKLEVELDGARRGRIIAVRSAGATDEQVDAYLAAQNIRYDPRRDLVPHIRVFGSPVPGGIELMNITEIREGRR